jgi:hypothetical protein
MKTYTIHTTDEVGIPVTAAEFFTALNTKDKNGDSLYHWYDDGEYDFSTHRYLRGDNNSLFPKASEHLSEVYRIHHNDIERQRIADIRRIRRGIVTNVLMVTEGEDGEPIEREFEDERAEANIYGNAEHNDLVQHLRSVLDELKALDREVVIALYGLDGQAPMSKTACAATLGKNWRTIDRAEERALAKLRVLLADFSDYGI